MRTQSVDGIQGPPDSKSYSNLIMDVPTTRAVKIDVYSL